jgi:predicted esterase
LINEETGQIFYYLPGGIGLVAYKQGLEIPIPKIIKPKEKHTATLIFLHGTYGVGSLDQMAEKFPGLKVIHPHSPTIQYDMWHGSQPAPGGQCQGWINITGDAWELMEADVIPTNQSRKKIKEADQIIHLDYHQLRRATNYINEIIEREIANGLPSEKIIIAGYSQGGLLTLATALTSPHKLGGFVSLCGFLPCWDKLLIKTKNLNQKTPCLIINNTKDTWIPFWTGQKTYEILKERGYKVEFKTHPCLGHNWKNEDVEEFLEKTLTGKGENYQTKDNFIENRKNTAKKAIIVVGAIGGGIILLFIIIKLIIWRTIKK